ncbi:hypothetical protein OO013_17540 [Mangrovivirga sp. M17]|uniref:Uncharacterized protein n=1 Tax=Mangrovivirga halotolerans TaxID=2993936 RepID=A0ABT3RX33_9BACT|nr:hypothetical protein [Mangrovivirga halotolerans]MCX2745690.1 hypothetical protein [Mangrovivirga halotolerans]
MFKNIIIAFFVLSLCSFSTTVGERTLNPIRENSFDFRINKDKLLNGSYQYYINFKPKGELPSETTKGGFSRYLKYDIYDVLNKNKDEDYHIIMSKTAYVVDAPSHFFSEHRLKDLSFVRKTLPEYEVNLSEEGNFQIASSGMAPDFEYSLKTFYPDYTDPRLKHFLNNVTTYDYPGKKPMMVTLQRNYNFSTVLWQKTNKTSIVFCAYYPIGGNKTLIINHTLNLVHNVPPKLIGGPDMMMDLIVEGITEYITDTNSAVKEYL